MTSYNLPERWSVRHSVRDGRPFLDDGSNWRAWVDDKTPAEVEAIAAEMTRVGVESDYEAQCARDAARAGQKASYCDYLERDSRDKAERYPERAAEFMGRSLAHALHGNDGD